jgi:hypothetical protein
MEMSSFCVGGRVWSIGRLKRRKNPKKILFKYDFIKHQDRIKWPGLEPDVSPLEVNV